MPNHRIKYVAGGMVVPVAAGLALTGCSLIQHPTAAASSPAPTASATAHRAHHRKTGISGKITAEHGNTWTVAMKTGKNLTVTITAQTQYGTKEHPATAAQFPVGTIVRVTGPRKNATVTALRVQAARSQSGGPSPSPSATG